MEIPNFRIRKWKPCFSRIWDWLRLFSRLCYSIFFYLSAFKRYKNRISNFNEVTSLDGDKEYDDINKGRNNKINKNNKINNGEGDNDFRLSVIPGRRNFFWHIDHLDTAPLLKSQFGSVCSWVGRYANPKAKDNLRVARNGVLAFFCCFLCSGTKLLRGTK